MDKYAILSNPLLWYLSVQWEITLLLTNIYICYPIKSCIILN